ncbi:hypothetical protein [Terribacillus sp. DMT04]|uniref:hypothetical protein n=1 Tax=Terribacillus sp. DMT04 TaxID=2850441 RepID=UPI001C2C03DD|nr:hypothetical protein [Terribacillus sp. DMT04]QXE01918.1 hypothetical protein KS242_01255 [Terribacillus sp. DMT04]
MMIKAEEVLELFDLVTGYGVDNYSRRVLQTLSKRDKRKHVTTHKNMSRYIESYIERKYKEKNNRPPMDMEERDSIIKIEGSTKGMRYDREGIILMLEDRRIKELLQSQLEKNTVMIEGQSMPKVVSEYLFAELNGIIEDTKRKEFYEEIKGDSTEDLKMKLTIMELELKSRETFDKMIKDYDEVAENRSPESLYYYDIKE